MAKSSINVVITGDASKLKRTLSDTESRLGKFASGAGGMLKKAGIGLAAVGAGAVIAAPKILAAGVELEALKRKADTVFEGSLGGVQQWADENAAAMGMTRDQLVGVAAGTADLLKPMGFAADEAAGLAMETNDLAGALSAWTGGQRSAEEVSKILTKAYLGEREGLKELGVSILEADVQQRLLEKGQKDLTGTALQQAKAIATQELIFEKTADAQKAWADGSMDAVKAQNETKASLERVKETMVKAVAPAIQAILPLVEKLANWFADVLPPAIQKVRDFFEENWPAIQAAVQTVTDWFQNDAMPVIKVVTDFIVEQFGLLVEKVKEHWPAIKETIDSTLGAIKVIVETIVGGIQKFWELFGDEIVAYAKIIWDGVKGIIEGALLIIRGVIQSVTSLIRGDWSGVWEGVKSILSGIWTQIKTIVSAALEVVKLAISGALGTIKSTWETVWNAVKNFIGGTWDSIKTGVSGGIDAVVGYVTGLPGRIASAVGNGFNALWDNFRGVVNRIIGAWNNLSFKFPSFDGDWNGPLPGGGFTVGGWQVSTPNIPYLAAGGIVPATPGGRLAVLGEGGQDEAVIPLDKLGAMSGGSGTVNNYITINALDGKSVVQALKEHERRNGPLYQRAT